MYGYRKNDNTRVVSKMRHNIFVQERVKRVDVRDSLGRDWSIF